MNEPVPTSQQAQRIIDKFGGVTKLSNAIGVNYSTVYKWGKPSGGTTMGTDGVIPRKHHAKIRDAADFMGIELTDDDWKV